MRTATRVLAAAGLLAVAAGVVACADGPATTPPAGTPTATAGPTVSSPTPSTRPVLSGSAGSDGLTVRYLDANGRVQTLPVEDFPR